MDGSRWRNITSLDCARLSEARLAAHYAAQWLARIARAYISPGPDDFHTNLGWSDSQRALTTHELPGGSRFGLKIPELTLVLWNKGTSDAAQAVSLEGRWDDDVGKWLRDRLREMGLDPAALDAPLPYQLPKHAIGSGAPYPAAALAGALAELAAWFGNANLVLGEARQRALARGLDAPPVRCWPHHFDLDSLVRLGGGRTVGAGFCPGDEYYDEPYFYVSRYPAPDLSRLPSLPLGGHWHTHNFTAAIALARNLVRVAGQRGETETFLNTAIDVLVES
jgi:hypothetical protein